MSYNLNDRFRYLKNGKVFVIKGAWNEKYPDDDHCFLMREDFSGHVYAGEVTPVKSVRCINSAEFNEMCGGHPKWFKFQKPDNSPTTDQKLISGFPDISEVNAEVLRKIKKLDFDTAEAIQIAYDFIVGK